MNDRLETDLWRKEVAERILDIKIMLLGIVLLVAGVAIHVSGLSMSSSVWYCIAWALMIIGVITGIVGFFRDREW